MQANKTTRLLTVSILAAISAVAIASADTAAPADPVAEEAYLDVLPKVEVPDDVQPIPGAVNEEFRSCRAQWPAEYEISQKGPEARAYRDIYGFVKVRNVIETRDCSCAGKVAIWDLVEKGATALREKSRVPELRAPDTDAIHTQAEKLFPIAEVMCGGKFKWTALRRF